VLRDLLKRLKSASVGSRIRDLCDTITWTKVLIDGQIVEGIVGAISARNDPGTFSTRAMSSGFVRSQDVTDAGGSVAFTIQTSQSSKARVEEWCQATRAGHGVTINVYDDAGRSMAFQHMFIVNTSETSNDLTVAFKGPTGLRT
jgi:hypothetical protein